MRQNLSQDFCKKGELKLIKMFFCDLKKNINYDERLKEKVDQLEESYFNIEDLFDEIKSNFKNDDFNPNDLEDINERLSVVR